ncbi:hypothetical protein PVAND_008011 [Polypedilum vanderplanki]|uniref:aralkylamine N-acetyltransferase n=1 Tax=Polypedilum vanderplanki TaxID=319348 RepID=A0A9J6C9L1_POLVA|nr:hypothetical protein PVAND_008011 [Polypedilum vanderplanki]
MNVIIRTAEIADLIQIVKFIKEHFVLNEPSLLSYQIYKNNNEEHIENENEDRIDDDDDFIASCIINGTSFVAHIDNQLIGIFIAGKIGPNEYENSLAIANASNDRKFADIMKFIAYVEEKADVCNHFHVPQSLHLHIISVHENYFGNRIASKLFKHCLDVTRADGRFPVFSVDCTSSYSARIAEKHNMELLSTVTYDEFNEFIGRKMFITREPHTLVKSYGIKF